MERQTKLFLGLGAYLLATASPAALLLQSPGGTGAWLLPQALAASDDAAGEAGEGGEGGGIPDSYRLPADGAAYDARPQVEAYAALVHASYGRALGEAKRLQAAVDALLAAPTEDSLAAARFAWINARVPYLQTEAFRFYDGPIDFADPATGREGPEGHMNAWPMNEAAVDYVDGDPNSGIVNDPSVAITRETILARDQAADEADVTTGWHAIEFLLWGQDLSSAGPGQRPASDYRPGQGNNDRRRLYLKTVTGMLVDDLAGLAAAWAPGKPDNYAARFRALDQREAIGRMLAGAASLAGYEMMSERLAVALDSGDQEDEQSCFSDNTRNDLIYDLRGARNVYFGDSATQDGAGLHELVARLDPALAGQMTALFSQAEAALDAIDQPFDQVLASPEGSVARQKAEAAVIALRGLAVGLKEVGRTLGVRVVVPSA